LENLDTGDALDEPEPSFVELLDTLDDVDPVFGAAAELLDDVEPGTFAGAPARRWACQLPADVIDRVPGQLAVGDHTPVKDRAVQVREPVEQHRRCHAGQWPVIDRDAPTVMCGVGAAHRRGVNSPERK